MNRYLKCFKKQIFIITIVLILRQLFLVLGQHLNAETFTNIVNKDFYKFLIVVLVTVLLWAIIIVSDKIMSVYEEQTKQSIGVKIRKNISEKIVATKYDEFSKNSTGNYISWLNNDIDNIMQNGISSYFNLIRGVAGIIFASAMLIYYHWFLLILTLIGFVAMMYIPKMFNKSIEQIGGEVTKENEKFILEIEDSLNGYKTLFSYSLTNNFITRIVNASNSLKNILVKKAKLYSKITAVNFSINVVFQIILTLVAGIFYFKGYIEIGVVAAVGALADIVFSGLSGVSYQIASIKSVDPIFKKYDKLLPEKIEQLSTVDRVEIYRLENVSLEYEKGKDVLNNFSMTIEKNKKYLIQGDSGSGKSTLLKLLLGYLPKYKGEIFYKNINLKNISSKNIAKEICYLNQEPHIFTGTIRDNITLGQQFSNNEVLEVLSLVGLESNTIDKFVGIQGSELSGGQKQKVALARALIRKPKILLLDEITSALDKESTLIIEKLVLTMKDVTVLMITHKIYKETEILFDEIYNL